MVIKITAAIGAYKQARKHILLAVRHRAFSCFAPFKLDFLEKLAVNYRLVNILKYQYIVGIIDISFLIFIRFGIGFEIYKISAIFLFG